MRLSGPIGRVTNRISGGKFNLDGIEYNLALNDGPNHLHGGLKGFNKVRRYAIYACPQLHYLCRVTGRWFSPPIKLIATI
jgi:hypothetical protein